MEDAPPLQPPGSPPLDPRTVAVIAAMGVFVAFLAAGLAVQPLSMAFGIWFTEVFVFFGLTWYVLRATGRNPVHYAGLTFPGMSPVVLGFALGVLNFFAIVAPIQYVSQALMPKAWREIYDVADIFRGQSTVELAVVVASVTIGAPVCEEFFFRGFFFQGLEARGRSPWKALVISAIVFSTFHLDPVGFLARLELGVLFGWLLLRTGSLWPGVLAHSANNLVSTVVFFSEKQNETSEAPPSQRELMLFLLFALACGTVLWGLLAATRRFPKLLGARRPAEAVKAPEPPVRLEPAPRLLALAIPWVFAATLSLGAYVYLDPLGVQLSRIDTRYPLAPVPEEAPDALHAEREALYELRVRARRGQIPVEEYVQERARQSKQNKPGGR